MITYKNLKDELLSDPDVKTEYDALGPLYDIKRELIQLRIDRGLSQKELADLVGTKQSSISRLESGDYNPSIQFLHRVANALDKEVHISFK